MDFQSMRRGRSAKRGIGFQPMVAVRRDIDRYSDRISQSFIRDMGVSPMWVAQN
jgi:hypothetical protein